MPPIVPRKRLRNTPPPSDENGPGKRRDTGKPQRRKATLYDDLDATSTPRSARPSSGILEISDSDDSISSLTSLSDEDFEDVPLAKREKVADSGDSDDDVEFEDVATPHQLVAIAPAPSGDLELTLTKDSRISLTNPFGDKKGPSKRERKVRNATHSVHVLLLLWHNAVRNSWLCDAEVQATLLSHLPPRLWDELERWKRNSGLELYPPQKSTKEAKGTAKTATRSTVKVKSKGKKAETNKKASDGEPRDWGSAAERLENGVVDMSHGDPLFRLMEYLVYWWKKRFRATTPGLRKWGYMSLERLDRLTKSYQEDCHDAARFGEHLQDLESFRECARNCTGSRDVGAQLFTALLRAIGLDARMVANLPCLGFGWNKFEDAEPEDEATRKIPTPKKYKARVEPPESRDDTASGKKKSNKADKSKDSTRRDKSKDVIISEDSDDLELERMDTDDESVIELAVITKKTATIKRPDQDLEFPHYWTEVLSPVTKKYLPVDAVVKGITGTNRELIESLEPRGIKADRSRQIMAYIVGYSGDGTAKDVTVRYLKRQVLPGRTKGNRMPIEKIPVHNRYGKVKRYEQFDWFKTAMSGYQRGTKQRPLTEVDEMEDATDLQPMKPEKKEVKEGEETLQYYKQSKEFVLQRHLKREEALRPEAAPVKIFKNKGKGGKVEEEDVYQRSDVLNVKSMETWHKQGRAPLPGEQPLKMVPYRVATLNRRRVLLEAEAATGQKVLQGLFSFDQTDWIIPPPIKGGIIPKNEYGNIDLFAEHMCPEGAVHVPFKGAGKVCKRLQIDYAEAVVDFEFGHRMAVPVIQGVVIPEEHHDVVMEELQKDEAERIRKEDEKRRKGALGRWRKFLMGLRIVERIRQDYGDIGDNVSVFGPHRGLSAGGVQPHAKDESLAGGFLPAGYEEEQEEGENEGSDGHAHHTSSFFPAVDDEDAGDDSLVMEHHGDESQPAAVLEAATASKEQSARTKRGAPEKKKKTTNRTAAPNRASRRKARAAASESEEDEEEWIPSDDDS